MSWVHQTTSKSSPINSSVPVASATRHWIAVNKTHLNHLLTNPLLFVDMKHKNSPEVAALIEQVVQHSLAGGSQGETGFRRLLRLGAPENVPEELQQARQAADKLIHKNVREDLEAQLRSLVAASMSKQIER